MNNFRPAFTATDIGPIWI